MDIRINEIGRILEGDYTGLLIEVVPTHPGDKDTNYLIFIWSETDNKQNWDGWVEKYEDIKEYFQEAHWKIEWLGNDYRLPFGITGCVTEGENVDQLIRIEGERWASSYKVRLSTWEDEFSKSEDIIVENEQAIRVLFKEKKWKVKWMD